MIYPEGVQIMLGTAYKYNNLHKAEDLYIRE